MNARLELARWSLAAALLLGAVAVANARDPAGSKSSKFVVGDFVKQYCVDCHNREEKTGGLSLEDARAEHVARDAETWEQVARKLRVRQMPPGDAERPGEDLYRQALFSLEGVLDRAAAAERPQPGRTNAMRRLTRVEYRNAVRDLLALDVDVSSLLPMDSISHGFDNVTVGDLSPARLNRYVSAARKISRLAVGGSQHSPGGKVVRLPADFTQEEHVAGLPLGSRGGAVIPYHVPQDGEYDVQVRLARDRNEEIEGLRGTHELELLLDRKRIGLFTVKPPRDKNFSVVDAHLKTRVKVAAGPHDVGATFLKFPSSLLETKRQPYHAH
ncbi:MAG: DUF1587 domain-containing protein, partial [Planctomycetales bacterium]